MLAGGIAICLMFVDLAAVLVISYGQPIGGIGALALTLVAQLALVRFDQEAEAQ